MKITKLTHACLLVEMPEPTNRTALFDPGVYSVEAIRKAELKFLDDIIITHEHFDHFSKDLVVELAHKFPEARILAPQSVVDILQQESVAATTIPSEGLSLFEAPHESMEPMGAAPEAIGVHYLDILTHPGDSYHFKESKEILALPMSAPWGATVDGLKLAVDLKPKIVVPIHDGFWRDDWRQQIYAGIAKFFESQNIEFIQAVDGEPFVLNLEQAQAS